MKQRQPAQRRGKEPGEKVQNRKHNTYLQILEGSSYGRDIKFIPLVSLEGLRKHIMTNIIKSRLI